MRPAHRYPKPVFDEGDGHAERRQQAAREVVRAVDRIDHPATCANVGRCAVLAFLFADDDVIGKSLGDAPDNQLLRFNVGLRDEIDRVGFYLDVQPPAVAVIAAHQGHGVGQHLLDQYAFVHASMIAIAAA